MAHPLTGERRDGRNDRLSHDDRRVGEDDFVFSVLNLLGIYSITRFKHMVRIGSWTTIYYCNTIYILILYNMLICIRLLFYIYINIYTLVRDTQWYFRILSQATISGSWKFGPTGYIRIVVHPPKFNVDPGKLPGPSTKPHGLPTTIFQGRYANFPGL